MKLTEKQQYTMKVFLESWHMLIDQLQKAAGGPTKSLGALDAVKACKIGVDGDAVTIRPQPHDITTIHGLTGCVMANMKSLYGGYVDFEVIE